MTRTYTICRADLKNKNLKSAERITTGTKPEVRNIKKIAAILRAVTK